MRTEGEAAVPVSEEEELVEAEDGGGLEHDVGLGAESSGDARGVENAVDRVGGRGERRASVAGGRSHSRGALGGAGGARGHRGG
jgi:hypothetical protein